MTNKKKNEHLIKYVYPGSIAEELELCPGDVLLEINGQSIQDVFDYRYMIKDEYIEVLVRKEDGEEWLLEIDKDYDDDLGLEFENSLMSEYRSCSNKCIFCFIDQMPPGMRETLYFKDDDSRLSFLQGNYITLTNMKDDDIDRIIKMQLAPINISVHSTNPELRCKLLNNRFAGEKLKYIQKLYDGHVEMNAQIVCCKGINDKDELEKTIRDLTAYLPYMRSVSVVPAGITKFREGLYPIELFDKEGAIEVVELVGKIQQECYDRYGLHFIHASDEFYIMAGRDFPPDEAYDGYIQLENGVGMMRLLITEFREALDELLAGADENNSERLAGLKADIEKNPSDYDVTIPVGELSFSTFSMLADELMEKLPGVKARVCAIRNDFFGNTITVTGLITGIDLETQLKKRRDSGISLGDRLLLSSNMLRSGEEVFLDDMTVTDIKNNLGMNAVPIEPCGYDLLEAILNKNYSMERRNDEGFVYVRAFDR
jgi:putative radical SAM enzyme (TIGR03279 family)